MNIIANSSLASKTAESDGLSCARIRFRGRGTEENPLLLSLILRHADFADESPFQKRYNETEKCSEALDQTLFDVFSQTSSMPLSANHLKSVLEIANSAADDTGTYYSAAVSHKVGKRLITAAIGHVKVWLYRQSKFRTLLDPTIMRIPNVPVESSLLNGSLGLGFDAEKIQVSEILLESTEFAIFAVQGELSSSTTDESLSDLENIRSANELIELVIPLFENEPGLVLVLTAD